MQKGYLFDGSSAQGWPAENGESECVQPHTCCIHLVLAKLMRACVQGAEAHYRAEPYSACDISLLKAVIYIS